MVTFWSHEGYGWGSINKTYQSKRLSIKADPSHDPRKVFLAKLGNGVSAQVPLSLWSDTEGTVPHPRRRVRPVSLAMPPTTSRDRATRLAAVVIAWNIFQHFYSYFDFLQTDWSSILGNCLGHAATDKDELGFLATLRFLTAQLHDGHAAISHPTEGPPFRAPITWDWIENRLVVTNMETGENEIHPGDVVRAIDGHPVATLLEQKQRDESGATKEWIRWMALLRLAIGQRNSNVSFDIESPAGQVYTKQLRRTLPLYPFRIEPTIGKVKEVRPGMFYVNLVEVSTDEFEKSIIPRIENAKGIIFDARGYITIADRILGHLTDDTMVSQRWQVPHVVRPDREGLSFSQRKQWSIKPDRPRLRAPCVFLVDRRDISHSETFLAFVAHYKLGTMVGGPTAGTNGDVNEVLLPGGFRLRWTGMKVLNQDGSPHHGIGIRPEIRVRRTIKGVVEGRDETLDTAIDVLTGHREGDLARHVRSQDDDGPFP